MAKFTAGRSLNIEWANHQFIGTPSTTYRVTDALVEEFIDEVVPQIPGFAWVTQDELTSIVTLPIAESDVTGLVADLAAKYPKAGGTVDGSTTVTGTLGVGGAATMSSTLVVTGAASVGGNFIAQSAATVAGAAVMQGSATVANALTVGGVTNLSSTLGVTGAATMLAAVNASSTLGVTGKVTLGNVVAIGGTAFPGSPVNNDIYYRTDYDLWFFYDGTRWLSVDLFEAPCSAWAAGATYTISISATQTIVQRLNMNIGFGADIWLDSVQFTVFVASGGTALGASHKWVATLNKIDTANAATSIATGNLDSGASNAWRIIPVSIGALLGTYASFPTLRVDWTKTGTPGNLDVSVPTIVTFRVVAT